VCVSVQPTISNMTIAPYGNACLFVCVCVCVCLCDVCVHIFTVCSSTHAHITHTHTHTDMVIDHTHKHTHKQANTQLASSKKALVFVLQLLFFCNLFFASGGQILLLTHTPADAHTHTHTHTQHRSTHTLAQVAIDTWGSLQLTLSRLLCLGRGMCVYVCIYALYTHTHTHTHTHTLTHTHTHTHRVFRQHTIRRPDSVEVYNVSNTRTHSAYVDCFLRFVLL